jgi:uroporphyrinogen decarboxylase
LRTPAVPFQPDYRHMLSVMMNERPRRLPVYEHIISSKVMEKILSAEFTSLEDGNAREQAEFFRQFCRFFKEMTYDTVSYEVCITDTLPGHGAIMGGRPGPIQTRRDFERYPWKEIPALFWEKAAGRFDALSASLPDGMKAVGGVGNGLFEISEDLVGFEYLSYLQVDDAALFSDLYRRIGDLMVELWSEFLKRYSAAYAICRFGDDLGFKTGLLLKPSTFAQHVLPQYQRVIGLIRSQGKPFLWHSCGNIFEIMDEVIALGINAKHSNEDAIAPFDRWIRQYNDRIGLLGGIDVDVLCQKSPDEVFQRVLDSGLRFRREARGYALGSGNSIPDYVPAENYLAMVRAACEIRARE